VVQKWIRPKKRRHCIKGSFLYVPTKIYKNCSNKEFRRGSHFLVLYLDKEINSDNWTQYIRSYEKIVNGKSRTLNYCKEVPKYGNRWTELFYDYTYSFDAMHFYRSDSDCNYKSKLDQIRN